MEEIEGKRRNFVGKLSAEWVDEVRDSATEVPDTVKGYFSPARDRIRET